MCKLTLLFAIAIFGLSHADTGLGSCPAIDPLSEFDMNRFLGSWYVIQRTDAAGPCASYNITRDEKHSEKYKITEIEQHPTLWSSALYHEHQLTGDLTVIDPKIPAKMALSLPLDVSSTTVTVFMTDYDHYAAIFICKKLSLIYSWSVEILSRARNLNMDYVDKIRTRISSYNIDPFSLQRVNHNKCAPHGQLGSLIQTVLEATENVAKSTTSNKNSKLQEATESTAKPTTANENYKSQETTESTAKSVTTNGNSKLQDATESTVKPTTPNESSKSQESIESTAKPVTTNENSILEESAKPGVADA